MTTIGRWSPNKIRNRVLDGNWALVDDFDLPMGMANITPISISFVGDSATIGPNGSFEFSNCSIIDINGIFSSSFTNYMLNIRSIASTAATNLVLRLIASGSVASGTDYTSQYIYANGTSVTGARTTSRASAPIANSTITLGNGDTVFIYGPFLAQPTAFRNVSALSQGEGFITDNAATHSLSTSYDGCRISANLSVISGRISVYGLAG